MAASGKGSRWGSFLSQAVAGVEARLDTILADNDESAKPPQQPNKLSPLPSPNKPSPAPSRSGSTGSTSRANDRLQERLARAVAAKNASASQHPEPSPARSSTAASPRQSFDVSNRPSLEIADPPKDSISIGASSPRTSQDVGKRPSLDASQVENAATHEPEPLDAKEEGYQDAQVNGDPPPPTEISLSPPLVEVTPAAGAAPPGGSLDLSEVHQSRVKQLETELDEIRRQHQEEMHDYIEKIDALQSKLQYLSREATDAARKVIQTAPAGSVEKRLAEKDQQIAQLMEEGKNLGVTEQKHRSIMKKLRSKMAEDEKEINELKVFRSKTEAELETLRIRAKRAAELEKAQDTLQKRASQAQRDLDAARAEIALKDRTISELKSQLSAASDDAEATTAKLNEEALLKERQKVSDLEEQVAALQVEKNLVADRAKLQANELKEKAERAAERARIVEVEMKSEVQITESKLEAMRIRAEEASSGAIGDSQAKLLRQVETLQSQYSIASENWQGIEASLLARVSSLEKDKDEALQRESEMRKKAREAALRAKRHEEDLEEARSKLPTVQEDANSYKSQLATLQKRADEAEAALAEARAEIEKQKAAWARDEKQDRDQSDSLERREWLDDVPTHPYKSNSRPESPLVHGPSRTWSSDLLGLQGLQTKVRKTSAPSSIDDLAERFSMARRPSAQPPGRPSLQAGTAGHPTPPLLFSPTVEALPTPTSTHPLEQDEVLDSVETSSSPQQMLQDMVSVSTVAAGPSVQLVERMSAAIRRLESEKVAAREDLSRISKQRDEARAEMVTLMREVEAGKTALKRVADLETEVADVNARYETTLELLGEKSEMVEELKADVQDVKAMYRDLVERTIK